MYRKRKGIHVLRIQMEVEGLVYLKRIKCMISTIRKVFSYSFLPSLRKVILIIKIILSLSSFSSFSFSLVVLYCNRDIFFSFVSLFLCLSLCFMLQHWSTSLVFQPDSSQFEVFEEVALPVVEDIVNGIHSPCSPQSYSF